MSKSPGRGEGHPFLAGQARETERPKSAAKTKKRMFESSLLQQNCLMTLVCMRSCSLQGKMSSLYTLLKAIFGLHDL